MSISGSVSTGTSVSTGLLIRHFIESLDGRLRWLEATETTVENWPDTGIDDDRRDAARRDSQELLVHVEQQLAACRRA